VFTYKSTLTDEERRIKEDNLDEQLEDLLATGFVLDRTRTLEKKRVHKYIINGQEVIEDCGIIAGEHIPLIPYYGNRSVIDGVEQVWGLVGPGKDAQQLYNMQVGVIGEQAALGGTSKPILMPEQIVGHEYMWAYDNIQRNPYLLLNSVRDANGQPMPAGPIAFTQAPVLSQATSALIDISNQMLEDSAFDMEAELRMEASEQFAVAEGAALVSGSGVGKPEGFMASTSGVSTTNSGHATTVTADGLISLKHAVKTAYTANANYVMNRTTLGSVRKLKDGNGNYLWQPGIAAGKPNSIDGDPYVELPDMPSEGAGLKPVAYGDFRRGYTLVDRIAMEMLRDPYTQATSGNIRFIFRRRLGGQVTLAEAIRKLKCSAS